jgi:hypothetical protein
MMDKVKYYTRILPRNLVNNKYFCVGWVDACSFGKTDRPVWTVSVFIWYKLYHNKHARIDAFHKITEASKEDVAHVTIEEVKKKLRICVRNTATSVLK